MLSYLGKHMPGGKVFHKQAIWVKLHGTRVVGGEPTNGNITLNEVKSNQDIIEVK
jgi:hypothetical protein